jgi:hypothetical protein
MEKLASSEQAPNGKQPKANRSYDWRFRRDYANARDRKALISDRLSSLVVSATGVLIFGETSNQAGPVQLFNHDIVAQQHIVAAYGPVPRPALPRPDDCLPATLGT